MQKKDRYDFFVKANYPEQNVRGKMLSLVPPNEIQQVLNNEFIDWQWTITHAGTTNPTNNSNGGNFVIGKLNLAFDDGDLTCSGAADSDFIGMAGLSMEALRHAVLRGASMGLSFYERDPDTAEEETEAKPPARARTAAAAPRGRSTGRSGGGRKNGDYPPWDGSVKVKSGDWAGTSYADVDDETIDAWADRGNNLAEMEQTRRGAEGGASEGARQTVNNSPFGRR